ncbi:sensor histidine kinase [Spirosoma sp. 209]|uniref:sensor histidine kinase n=1 Tax=Spirosoma sp. 209 TaxID=1955701 RepID=UPI0013748195|nr:histidine kinase [Spirosoma sp. 209]
MHNEKTGYWSSFAGWLGQQARPFVARWWLWIVLVVSPAYLVYYFTESSLEKRISIGIQKAEKRDRALAKETGQKASSSYRAGILIGTTVRLIVNEWPTLLLIALLIAALLRLHYLYVFQVLFERDAIGRRVYVVVAVVGWLTLAAIFSMLIGQRGAEYDYHWTLANSFVLMNIGYSLVTSWQNSRRRQQALIQQRIQAELDALKAQVNPHFLFNSLNNIYGTAIVENSPRTAESIQQLSGIVRYVMEESRQKTTDIQRELRFIDDYVELQRVRIPDQANIRIDTDIQWDERPAQIVPLLLNPLIENAFKYGISIQQPCFVRIRLRVQDNSLHLGIENSILPRTDLEKGTGLWLANVRQRLALAYPNQHTLRITDQNDTFSVDLSINLSPNG